ncbi:hypothetical protein [Mycobacterium sp. 1274756.6]|uniref:YncE family protein n=1 Tax=Mycobacterium sp. 1274756.6 TaxID=1834076 RepID=UPI000B0E1D4A|nr:hypothetical protein [Mycobacterium sp. 1274756.6]
MHSRRWPARAARALAVAAVAAATVVGCTSAESDWESSPPVTVAATAQPLRAPAWSAALSALVALTDDGRLARVDEPDDPDRVGTAVSGPLAAGDNLRISGIDPHRVFVPRPDRQTVTLMDLDTLRPVEEVRAGPAPNSVDANAGLRVLLVLSEDGRSVTPVDEHGLAALPTATVEGAAAESVIGSARGRRVDYHLFHRGGVRHYRGAERSPEQLGALAVPVAAAAADHTKTTRSYVAAGDTVRAVESQRGGDGLAVIGEVAVPAGSVRYLAADDTRLYIATDRALVVARTASFTGYPDGAIPIIRVIDYRDELPAGPARSAEPSGLAVGTHRVYLTLAGQPYLVSIAKPGL